MKRETTVDISKHKDLKEFVTQVRNQKEDAEVIQGLITPKANRERGRGWLPELRTLGGGGVLKRLVLGSLEITLLVCRP